MTSPTEAKRVSKFCIPADHPALPGHFPGQPVVPGVVLLSRVLDFAQAQFGSNVHIGGIDQAKFLAPLLPDQEAQIALSLQPPQLRFSIERGPTVIAQGSFRLTDAVQP